MDDTGWVVTNRFLPAYQLESFTVGEGLAGDLEPAALLAVRVRRGTSTASIDVIFSERDARDLHQLLGQIIAAWDG